MNMNLLKQYAELIVKTGANVQPGQKVRVQAEVDQALLAKEVTESCYRAGASLVELVWTCGSVERLHYQYADPQILGTVLPWEEERLRQMSKDLPVRIFIESADPDKLSGISADVLSSVARMRSAVTKKYRDEIDGKHQWLIVAAPSPAWAKKVFPGEEENVAIEKLWQAIFDCVYLKEGEDAVAVWKEHNQKMSERAAWLNEQHFVRLEYKSSNGTDFSVELIPEAKWSAAEDINHTNGVAYTPNMPTEEVFTSPKAGACEGRLVSTKALSWSGHMINNFTVDFKNGRVSSCRAEVGEETLKQMFAMDEGASMLGEIALVPKESPINRSGLMFYNTLFDENACCHVAVGRGFSEVLDGFIDMSLDEIHAKGINDSTIHVDFMVGSEDLDITGFRADGSSAPIFVNGTWAE